MGVGPVLGNSPLKGVLGTSSFDTGGPRILLLQHCLLFAWSCRSVHGWAVNRFCEALASRSPDFLLEAVKSLSVVTVFNLRFWASWQRTESSSTCSQVSGHWLGPFPSR